MPAAAVADVAETGPAEAPLVIRKGVWIYDADEGENGQDYVVWKRAKMSLETEDKRKRRCDGA